MAKNKVTVSVTWHMYTIQTWADSRGITLSDEQARECLAFVEYISGVTWADIDAAIFAVSGRKDYFCPNYGLSWEEVNDVLDIIEEERE